MLIYEICQSLKLHTLLLFQLNNTVENAIVQTMKRFMIAGRREGK
jgi:hypothetical protein